jgi:hypothetical protein
VRLGKPPPGARLHPKARARAAGFALRASGT